MSELNTISNKFFEEHPDKVLGEFSISEFMNKIIVKGNKAEVQKYFEKKLSEPNTEIAEPEQIKEEPKMNKPKEESKAEKVVIEQKEIAKKETSKQVVLSTNKFKVLSVEDTIAMYSSDLSDSDIKAFVWYNQTLGIPMTGWERWFIYGAIDNTAIVMEDTDFLNQQFKVIGRFQKSDTIGKATRFTHEYNGIQYVIVRKLDGALCLVDRKKIETKSTKNVDVKYLNELVIENSLFYINGDYVPLHIYTNTDSELLDSSLKADKEFILKTFGQNVFDYQKDLITASPMRIDAPQLIDRYKLNPYSEIARETKTVYKDTEMSVTDAFEVYVRHLKNSDFQLVSKNEFVYIILYERTRADRYSTDEEKKKKKEIVSQAKIEIVRIFSDFCTHHLDTETRTTLNRVINLTYNRSIKINTSKIPVGFVCSNKFGDGIFKLKPVQIEGYKFAVSRNNWCLALTVGYGKTSLAISVLSYFMTSGALKKPLVIVPKPVMINWRKEMLGFWVEPKTRKLSFTEKPGFIRRYGILTDCGIDVVNIGNLSKKYIKEGKDLKNKTRVIALGSYEALKNMHIENEETRQFIINEWYNILSEAKDDPYTEREEVGKLGKLIAKLNKVDKSSEIDIQSIGFDGIIFDEAHRLKNMFTRVKADKTNRISSGFTGASSDRALRGFYICLLIQKQKGRIGFLTATPFSNTPLEVFTMLTFLGYNELCKNNVFKIEKFVEIFFNETLEYKVDSKNNIITDSVMKNYKNKPILNTLLSNIFLYRDKPQKDAHGVEHPARPCIIRYPREEMKLMLKMSTIQSLQRDAAVGKIEKVIDYIQVGEDVEVVRYAEQIVQKFEIAKALNPLGFAGSMLISSKISALSPFAGSPVSVDFITSERWSELYNHSPKVRFTIDAIKEMMQYHKSRGENTSSFLIYTEVGINILPYFKEALEHHCGLKRNISVIGEQDDDEKENFDEVEIIEGTASSDREANRRDKIQTLFNAGKVKIIIGTSTIKEGLNLQTNCATLFILTPSWNSTDITQIEGRVYRQGNRFGYVRVVTPIVSRSMDSFIYQKYEEKAARITDIWQNDGKSDTEDLNTEIPPQKQKELILDDANEIAKIRCEMNGKKNLNIYNKCKDDFQAVETAVKMSAPYNELLSYHFDKLPEMLSVCEINKKNLLKTLNLIDTDKEAPSFVKSLKSRVVTLIEYYDELILSIKKANESKLPVDLVNIIGSSFARRKYHFQLPYNDENDFKVYLAANGVPIKQINNLFESETFAGANVYTQVSDWDSNFNNSFKRLKLIYGASALSEKFILEPEGLNMRSNIEDLNEVVDKYNKLMDSVYEDISANFEFNPTMTVLKPKTEYFDKIQKDVLVELAEENKLAMKSDVLGVLFAEKTNNQLSYLSNSVDKSSCEIRETECCDTNEMREDIQEVSIEGEAQEYPQFVMDESTRQEWLLFRQLCESMQGFEDEENDWASLLEMANMMLR